MRRNLTNNELTSQKNPELPGNFEHYLLRSVARILTQLDRDPDSPTFGCFDRDFWHYKVRDFASIVLQQGALVLETLYNYSSQENFLYREPKVLSWVNASIGFWARQQLPSGAFNEYYPFEEGFPPTAFSLYAVALIFQKRGFPEAQPDVLLAIQKAVDSLLSVQERQALNQESVALTAVELASRIPGVKLDRKKLDSRFVDFFAAQSSEGWFPEYGGADTGYLSVTLDALSVYYDLTGDARADVAMNKALEFISMLVSVSGSTPVMTNSRNTDYIAPYGLLRMAESSPLARCVFEKIFSCHENPGHFLNATDDRYLCHYIYQSCFRGLEQLSRMTALKTELPCEKVEERFFPDAGIHILHTPGKRSVFTAARKGGVYYVYTPQGVVFADFGWRQKNSDGRVALTHWQHPENGSALSQAADSTVIEAKGTVSLHCWTESTPLRHAALRVLSYLFGRKIIAWLKMAMIFKAESYGIHYIRKITITPQGISCCDSFRGKRIEAFNPVPAPAYSLRHVASAGNFTKEELTGPECVTRIFKRENDCLVITSSIQFKEMQG